MTRNPIANPGQFAAEEEVRAMWRLETIRTARARSGMLWKTAYGDHVPEEAHATFEQAMDEYVTNYLFKAAACDAAHPRFVRNFMQGSDSVEAAIARYVAAVKDGSFPAAEHCF